MALLFCINISLHYLNIDYLFTLLFNYVTFTFALAAVQRKLTTLIVQLVASCSLGFFTLPILNTNREQNFICTQQLSSGKVCCSIQNHLGKLEMLTFKVKFQKIKKEKKKKCNNNKNKICKWLKLINKSVKCREYRRSPIALP